MTEIEVICDMMEHPHHKGKVQHIATFEPHHLHGPGGVNTWLLSKQDSRVDKQRAPRNRVWQPVNEAPSETLRTYYRIEAPQPRPRYVLVCRKCNHVVPAREESLRWVLDQLQSAEITRITLNGLAPRLDSWALARKVAREVGGVALVDWNPAPNDN